MESRALAVLLNVTVLKRSTLRDLQSKCLV